METTDYETKSLLQKIERKYRKCPFANYAFGIYLFIEQIYEESIQNHYKKIVFLAREGYLLKFLFELYQSNRNVYVQTEYLYASRLSTFLPSLKPIEEECFDAILIQYADISLGAFLRNLQFEEEIIKRILGQLGLEDNKIIFDFRNSNEFKMLRENSLFIEQYSYKRNEALKALTGYMDLIFQDQEPIVIVDIGWKGTMQDNLYKIYSDRSFIGLYYGLFAQTGYECKNNIKKGLLFQRFPIRSKCYYVWEFETHLIEQLFAAPHGSTKNYIRELDQYVPVLEQSDDDRILYSASKVFQDNIVKVFEELVSVMGEQRLDHEELFKISTLAQLRAELCLNSEMIEFEKLALTEKTNNFGWFATIPLKSGRRGKIKKVIENIRSIHNQNRHASILKYLSYFSIKMNAREKFGWKKIIYRFCYVIERCLIIKELKR